VQLHVLSLADAAAKDAAAVEANNVLLLGLLDDAEQQLAKTSYLAGPAYSVADVMFTPLLFR
jgi:glutathione S-transferase